MSTPPSCPYCNAPLAGLSRTDDAKALCPRCGEALPASISEALPASMTLTTTPSLPPKPVKANRRLGLLILMGMALVAGVAAVYALLTVRDRRSRDPDLPVFAYLPRDANLAAGIDIADLLADPDAATLLGDNAPPWLEWISRLIRTKTGLQLEDVEQILIATRIADKLPTVAIVVRTKAAYVLEDVEIAQKPAKPTVHRGRPLYRFSVAPLGEAFLWCGGPRSLVFLWRIDSLNEKDLSILPQTAPTEAEAVPELLRDYVTKRLEKQSLLWIAGDVDRLRAFLDALEPALLFTKNAPRLPEPWRSARYAGLSLTNPEGKGALTVRGNFLSPDRKHALALEAALEKVTLPGQDSRVVAGPPPDARHADDLWVTWQARLSVEGLRGWLAMWAKAK